MKNQKGRRVEPDGLRASIDIYVDGLPRCRAERSVVRPTCRPIQNADGFTELPAAMPKAARCFADGMEHMPSPRTRPTTPMGAAVGIAAVRSM